MMNRRYTTDKDGISLTGKNGKPEPVTCQWHSGCDSRAVTTRPHPALGNVPICDGAA